MQQQPPLPPPPEDDLPGGSGRKSERKRQRERQRRSALASAFDELAALLTQIEPEHASSLAAGGAGSENIDSSTGGKARKRRRASATGTDPDLENSARLTQLDLIGRTVGVLRRLQQENVDMRRRLMEGGSMDNDLKVRFCSRRYIHIYRCAEDWIARCD